MKLYPLLLFLSFSILANSQNDTVSVYFNRDSDILTENQRKTITFLTEADFDIISLAGHCDTNGTLRYNAQLATRRIKHVQSILNAESAETTVVGEKDAAKAHPYNDQAFRKVDIVYKKTVIPIKIEAEMESSPTPEEDFSLLAKSFEGFLTDSSQTETTIQLSLLFVNNTGILLPESKPELEKLYNLMHDNPSIKAHIRGHICCMSYCTWDEISDERAYFVYKFLKYNSIDPNRISFKGYGTSIPFISPEITEEDRRLNRRVDIIFTKQK